MPNLKGPEERKRRLYGVLHSVILYGAPVWGEALRASRENRAIIHHLQKLMAIRVISAYRTVFWEAAILLARTPPLDLLALARKRAYERVQDLKESGQWSKTAITEIRSEEELLLRRQWYINSNNPNLAGIRTRAAILSHLSLWLERKHGGMTFHLTQLLTGHGCFNTYLYRIQKVDSPICEHCTDGVEDSAEHTLAVCSAWQDDRDELTRVVGNDLSLTSIISAISTSSEAWKAMASFAERVMWNKEEAERRRQAQVDAPTLPLSNSDDT